jgi:hypothetical protein
MKLNLGNKQACGTGESYKSWLQLRHVINLCKVKFDSRSILYMIDSMRFIECDCVLQILKKKQV